MYMKLVISEKIYDFRGVYLLVVFSFKVEYNL